MRLNRDVFVVIDFAVIPPLEDTKAKVLNVKLFEREHARPVNFSKVKQQKVYEVISNLKWKHSSPTLGPPRCLTVCFELIPVAVVIAVYFCMQAIWNSVDPGKPNVCLCSEVDGHGVLGIVMKDIAKEYTGYASLRQGLRCCSTGFSFYSTMWILLKRFIFN
ncbi:unnamed protein product [Hermetia illucens]|uniref:Uncharacterized protein n=1 Tax=Hermetia illucens TaxID=343691 RepID=A0A7R8UQT2_HERIL|nr:unnamed protein product [Hermetia illucens]